MGKRTSVQDLEGMGFAIKKKPKVSTGKTVPQKPKIVEKVIERPVEKIVHQPVAENSGVLAEVQKTNQVMHSAIEALTETMQDLGYRPKSLKCHSIERSTQTGLMKSFEISIVE